MSMNQRHDRWAHVLLWFGLLLATVVYWHGLKGGFLFDDYPNIVDNRGVQPTSASLASLARAALSSPSSDFKRPLASLSFAANYLATGLDPYWMKLTNLVIHLLNGLLVYVLARAMLVEAPGKNQRVQPDIVAALIAAGWMLLPINLTAVLYVVQRMESMANLFVLLGLIGYVTGRRRMLDRPTESTTGFLLCLASIIFPAAIGILAKETAVMLPLYALSLEWALFSFRRSRYGAGREENTQPHRWDVRIVVLFLLLLVLPIIVGLGWLLPGLLKPETWATRDFSLGTRLLSETRIVVDYVSWTLIPTPGALSFYHDDFCISTGLLTPWSTLASIALLAVVLTLMVWLRSRLPLAALGIALFLGCQLLTGTILPLELIYEHRNYFASFGLLLAVVPLLAVPRSAWLALPRHVLLAGLMLLWTALTAITSYSWGNPLRLAEDLALRAPQSPRAQYELGRTFIIYSHYDPDSPFTRMAYPALERAAALPDSSILPEQALIFMNARMRLPLKDAWWESLIAKLKARKSTVQDESSLGALTQCAKESHCDLPQKRMVQAYRAALSHPFPSARLLAMYGDYAWNSLDDHLLGEQMTNQAVKEAPRESAYRITLVRMLAAQGQTDAARAALHDLEALNVGGSLDGNLSELRALPGLH